MLATIVSEGANGKACGAGRLGVGIGEKALHFAALGERGKMSRETEVMAQ